MLDCIESQGIECSDPGHDDRGDREWMIDHFEARLHELMRRGAHHSHPWITERYESDLMQLYKAYARDNTHKP